MEFKFKAYEPYTKKVYTNDQLCLIPSRLENIMNAFSILGCGYLPNSGEVYVSYENLAPLITSINFPNSILMPYIGINDMIGNEIYLYDIVEIDNEKYVVDFVEATYILKRYCVNSARIYSTQKIGTTTEVDFREDSVCCYIYKGKFKGIVAGNYYIK